MAPDFALRRRLRAYAVGAGVGVLVSLAVLVRVLRAHDWRLLQSLEIGWILLAMWIYLGLRYQVLWRNGSVVMRAVGRPETAISTDEIIGMGIDDGQRMRLLGFNLSADRIKITGKAPAGEVKAVFVSLGHFMTADILKLVHAIGVERPDLLFPRSWKG